MKTLIEWKKNKIEKILWKINVVKEKGKCMKEGVEKVMYEIKKKKGGRWDLLNENLVFPYHLFIFWRTKETYAFS